MRQRDLDGLFGEGDAFFRVRGQEVGEFGTALAADDRGFHHFADRQAGRRLNLEDGLFLYEPTTPLHDLGELANLVRDPAYAAVLDRLTRLWWRYRDCAGAACTRELPAPFRSDAGEVEAATIRQRSGVEDRFGEPTSQREGLRR